MFIIFKDGWYVNILFWFIVEVCNVYIMVLNVIINNNVVNIKVGIKIVCRVGIDYEVWFKWLDKNGGGDCGCYFVNVIFY